MDNLESLLASMRRTFDGDAESVLARALLDFVGAYPSTSHITPPLVRRLVTEFGGALDVPIVRTLQYLSGPGVQLLDMRFELLQDGVLEPVLLTDDDVAHATRDKVNPISGESDVDVEKKIAIFFSPTALMKGRPQI